MHANRKVRESFAHRAGIQKALACSTLLMTISFFRRAVKLSKKRSQQLRRLPGKTVRPPKSAIFKKNPEPWELKQKN